MYLSPRRHPRVLAVSAMIGVAVYVVLDVIAQLLPPHYSVLHQPESNLGVGPYSAIMNTNFVVRGLTALTTAALIMSRPTHPRQRLGALLIATWGICSGLLSVFHTDVTNGAVLSSSPTTHGTVHLALAFAGFFAGNIGIALLSAAPFRRFHHTWPMTYAPVLLLVVFVAAAFTTDLFGLFERLFIASMLLWTTAVAADQIITPTHRIDPEERGDSSHVVHDHVAAS
jgi:hypothetical membrane protein